MIIESKIRTMGKILRAPHLDHQDYPDMNLFQFARRITRHLQEDLLAIAGVPAADREKAFTRFQTKVILFTGIPGSGKTFLEPIVEWFMRNEVDGYRWIEGDKFIYLNWERDGEERARRRGLIKTPREKSFSDIELNHSADHLEMASVEALEKRPLILGIEVPATTAFNTELSDCEPIWAGRSLGTQMVFNLTRKRGKFRDLSYSSYIAGLIGGPAIRNVMVHFRDEFSEASTLEEAQQITRIYGKRVPQTQEEWEDLKNGANTSQMKFIEDWLIDLLHFAEREKYIKRRFKSAFRYAYPEKLRGLIPPENMYRDYEMWSVASLMEYLFRNKYNYNLDPDRIFIGYNSPSLEELGIPNIEALIKHLQERGQLLFNHISEAADRVQ